MMQFAFAAGYTSVALILLVPIGNELCRLLLEYTRLKQPDAVSGESAARAGRVIGTLERLILAVGIIGHSWEVLAAVIALKTLARFSEMDKQNFAEYFLVGSLFSLLWAVVVTLSWKGFDAHLGIDLSGTVATYLAPAMGSDPTTILCLAESPMQITCQPSIP